MRSLAKHSGWLVGLILSFSVCESAQTLDSKAEPPVTIPARLMNDKLTTIDGRYLKLSDYPNKILVLNLFASWCEPCVKNLSDLNRVRKIYKNRVQVIGLTIETNDPKVERLSTFAQRRKIKFPLVLDDVGFSESLCTLINGPSSLPLTTLPQTFVLDRSGTIRKHFLGFNRSTTPPLVRQTIDEIRRETR